MKLTDSKLNANRDNATHSTGPRTPEGKARSRLNATRHGLTGQTVVLPNEDLQIYASFCKDFFKEIQPGGCIERHLVQNLADSQWRIHRGHAREFAIYANGQDRLADRVIVDHVEVHAALTAGLVQIEQSQELDRLGRHISRLKREFNGTLKQLQQLQAERKQREQKQMAEAALLRKFHEMNETTFDPAAYGFVLSVAEIDAYIRREEALEQARIAQRLDFNREKYRATAAR